MDKRKKMALVAHDNMKHDLAEWVDWNFAKLRPHSMVCTGTTGRMVEQTLMKHYADAEECQRYPLESHSSSRGRSAETSSWDR